MATIEELLNWRREPHPDFTSWSIPYVARTGARLMSFAIPCSICGILVDAHSDAEVAACNQEAEESR